MEAILTVLQSKHLDDPKLRVYPQNHKYRGQRYEHRGEGHNATRMIVRVLKVRGDAFRGWNGALLAGGHPGREQRNQQDVGKKRGSECAEAQGL